MSLKSKNLTRELDLSLVKFMTVALGVDDPSPLALRTCADRISYRAKTNILKTLVGLIRTVKTSNRLWSMVPPVYGNLYLECFIEASGKRVFCSDSHTFAQRIMVFGDLLNERLTSFDVRTERDLSAFSYGGGQRKRVNEPSAEQLLLFERNGSLSVLIVRFLIAYTLHNYDREDVSKTVEMYLTAYTRLVDLVASERGNPQDLTLEGEWDADVMNALRDISYVAMANYSSYSSLVAAIITRSRGIDSIIPRTRGKTAEEALSSVPLLGDFLTRLTLSKESIRACSPQVYSIRTHVLYGNQCANAIAKLCSDQFRMCVEKIELLSPAIRLVYLSNISPSVQRSMLANMQIVSLDEFFLWDSSDEDLSQLLQGLGVPDRKSLEAFTFDIFIRNVDLLNREQILEEFVKYIPKSSVPDLLEGICNRIASFLYVQYVDLSP